MKRQILTFCLLALTALSFSSTSAKAQEPKRCALEFDARGGGLQIGFGHFKMKGTGSFTCVDNYGSQEVLPVLVTIGHHHLAPRVGIGYFKIHGTSSTFLYDNDIASLLGDYAVLGAQAAIGVGGQVNMTLHNTDQGLDFQLNVFGLKGFGAAAGVSFMKLEPLF